MFGFYNTAFFNHAAMKNLVLSIAMATLALGLYASKPYVPSPEVMQSRSQFASDGFGIFIHWGIYSMFGQGEWYLNYGPSATEYAKAARGFFPADFNARKWVADIKRSGARYICFTSRHHDGFSMWHTSQSPYNIVNATPFGRDVLKELADACHEQGIALHLYYSHLDWTRPDYPRGRTGHTTGRDSTASDWPHYYDFMNRQLTELLSNYGSVRAIWFDGWWDHDSDSTAFDWQLDEQYSLIHRLQPACMVGNNHHQSPFNGEDIQIFERDLPGENSAGLSGQEVSRLPLETCNTMNGMWGYKICDQDYKSARELIHYLVKARGMGANLLLNIGPQPSGALPDTAIHRLHEIGEWMDIYSPTVYSVTAGDFPAMEWGTTTRKGDKLFVHIINPKDYGIYVPTPEKVKQAVEFVSRRPVKFRKVKGKPGVTLELDSLPTGTVDYVVELRTCKP